MIASPKQISYLFDLVVRHPDFQKAHDYQVYETTNEWVLDWIKEKYAHFLNVLTNDLTALDADDASALISHLIQGEQERQRKV